MAKTLDKSNKRKFVRSKCKKQKIYHKQQHEPDSWTPYSSSTSSSNLESEKEFVPRSNSRVVKIRMLVVPFNSWATQTIHGTLTCKLQVVTFIVLEHLQ